MTTRRRSQLQQQQQSMSQPATVSRLRRTREQLNLSSQPQPRPSTSSMNSSVAESSSDGRSELVENCVQALLVLHQNKLPIRKAEISKLVFRQNGKMFKTVMEECAIVLKDIYGFKLVEVPEKSSYILINNLNVKDAKLVPRSTEENIERGLLLTVLSVLFMSGGELKDDKLYKFLEKLGFNTNSKTPLEGLHCSIVELVTQRWVRQLYLKYEKIEYSEPTEHVFRWGFRADVEVKKTDVLKFVCDIWGDKATPEKWRKQWAMAHARTELQEQNGNAVIIIQ